MEMTSRQIIAAPPERVWDALNDPEILQRCIPGCETLEKVSDTEMTAVVVLKVGPVKARFNGKVSFQDVSAPRSLILVGEGSGGIAGHARGQAHVDLEADVAGTALTYAVKAAIGGKIAQLGARLIDSTSAKLATEFFNRFEQEVAISQPAVAES